MVYSALRYFAESLAANYGVSCLVPASRHPPSSTDPPPIPLGFLAIESALAWIHSSYGISVLFGTQASQGRASVCGID